MNGICYCGQQNARLFVILVPQGKLWSAYVQLARFAIASKRTIYLNHFGFNARKKLTSTSESADVLVDRLLKIEQL